MARPYNAANDPIRLGLASLGEGILAGQKRRLAESQAATEAEDKKFQRALQERQAKLLEGRETREQKEFDVKNAPVDYGLVEEYLPESYKTQRTPQRREDVEAAYDAGQAYPKDAIPQIDLAALMKAREVATAHLKATKEAKEKPTIHVRRGDYNTQFGIPADSGGSPDDILEVPAPALTRPPVAKPSEDKSPSPGFAKIASAIAAGEADISAADGKIRTAGDQNLLNQALTSLRHRTGIDAADKRTVSGQVAAAKKALEDRLFRRGEREASQGFQAGQKDIDRSIRKGEFAENKDIARQNLAVTQDRYARDVLQDEMSPAMQKHWSEVVAGKNILQGLPKIATDRDKEALAALKDIAPGVGKIDQRIVRPAYQAQLDLAAAGKLRPIDVKPVDGYVTVAESAEKQKLIANEANQISRGLRQSEFDRTMTGKILDEGEKDLTARTKELVEQKQTIAEVIPDLLSGESGRIQAAQQRLASILNKGRPTDADYARAGIVGGVEKKMRAWFQAVGTGKEAPDITGDRARFFADAEKVINAKIQREINESRLGVKAKFKATGTPLPKTGIDPAIGADRFNTDTPAAEAVKTLEERAAEEAKKPGFMDQLGSAFSGKKKANPSTQRKIEENKKRLREIDKLLGK